MQGPKSPTSTDVDQTESPETGTELLRRVLRRLPHLDLSGMVTVHGAFMTASGGNADVFIGHLQDTKVAIKRIRVHLSQNRDFAKASSDFRVQFHDNEIRPPTEDSKGTIHMVKARSPECTPTVGIHSGG